MTLIGTSRDPVTPLIWIWALVAIIPPQLSNNQPDKLMRHTVFCGQFPMRSFARRVLIYDRIDIGCCQLCLPVCFASDVDALFGMRVRPVAESYSTRLGLCSRAVPVASCHLLGASSAPMSISAGQTFLLCCVFHVVFVGAEEQMIGTDAESVIALMKNTQVSCRPVVQLVRKSVSENKVSFYPNLAVACGSRRSCPDPTTV